MKNLIIAFGVFLIMNTDLSYSQITFYKSVSSNNIEPYSMAISKDNKFAYVATPLEIQIYNRNDTTGDLSFLASVNKMNDKTAINWAYSVAISPDSKYLYVSSGEWKTFVLKRDVNTGMLTPFQTIIDETTYSSNITPNCIIASKDQKNVYSSIRDNLYVYSRDSLTDSLKLIESHHDLNYLQGMSFDVSCELSYDNRFIYVTGGNGITVFKRNPSTGMLTFKQEIVGTNYVNQGLAYARESKASSDNRFLYTVTNSMGSGAIVVLYHNPVSDTLSVIQTHSFDYNTGTFLHPNSLILSPNKKALCASSQDMAAFFKIDTISGKIEFSEAYSSSSSLNYLMGGRKIFDNSSRFLYNCPAFTNFIYTYKLNVFYDTLLLKCNDDSLEITPFNNYKSYLWSTSSKKSNIKVSKPGKYILEVSDEFNNLIKDTVTVLNGPIVNLGKDTTLLKNRAILLSPGFDYAEYTWSIDYSHYSHYLFLNDSTYTRDTTISISVTVKDKKGCSNSDTIKIHLLTATSINGISSSILKIFPNPVSDYIYIESDLLNFRHVEADIYNSDGMHIYQCSLRNESKINVSFLKKGSYILKISYADKSISTKFIKK
jgi:6-phosphogluconolactonase (cycloisomerase 2 family)